MKFALIDAEKATARWRLLQGARRVAARVLRVATAARIYARPRGSATRGEGARVVPARSHILRQPADLKDLKADDEHVSRKRVIRLMQEQGLVARVRRRYKCTTMSDHDQPVAANILAARFEAERPNQRWVGDTTELRVGESGRVFLAAILDLYSRFVVGWALSAVNDRHLAIKALDMALRRRCPEAGLLHHSDQGSTYASEDYQNVLGAHGITCSMSRRGNCYDNAAWRAGSRR